MLVHLKRLDLELNQPHKDRTSLNDCKKRREELIRKAREAGIVNDLSKVLRACEVGITLEWKIRDGKTSEIDRKRFVKRKADVIHAIEREEVASKSAFGSFFPEIHDSSSVLCSYRLALMSKNMNALEEELSRNLGYTPNVTKADAQHLALVASNAMGSTLFKVSMATVGGLFVSLILSQK